jgi:hypothetical protein
VLQGCVIVLLQGCVIVLVRARLRDCAMLILKISATWWPSIELD